MKKILLVLVISVANITLLSAQRQGTTNDDVLGYLSQGMSSDSIVSILKLDSVPNLNLDIGYMRQLKQRGATEDLITYIQKRHKKDNTFEGIYWWNTGDGRPLQIKPTAFQKEGHGFNVGTLAWKTMTGRGVGYIVQQTAGAIAKSEMKKKGMVPVMLASKKDFKDLYLNGKNAETVIYTTTPVFRIYLPGNDMENFSKEGMENWYKAAMIDVQNPDEMQIVKLKQKGKRRIFDKSCDWEGGCFEGKQSSHRYVMEFTVTQFNNNTFEITLLKPLKPGEYVFFWKNGIHTPIFQQHVFGFDFSIPKGLR